MGIETVVALALASFVFMASPGPGVFGTTARALAFGFRATLPFILGVALGDLIYLLFAIFGLAVVADVLGELFVVVRWAGAAYLIYIGVKAWRQKPEPLSDAPPQVRRADSIRAFTGGLFLTLGNPKTIIFYLSFLPTFVDLVHLTFADGALLAGIVIGTLLAVISGYAAMAARARSLFRSETNIRRINRTAGAVMIGAGCTVAVRT